MARPLLLADVGGTYVRLREVDHDGEKVKELQEVGPGVGDGTIEAEMDELSAVVHRCGVALKDVRGGMHLVVAARGFGAGRGVPETVRQIAAFVHAARVTVVPDGVAAYIGNLGDKPGVVVTVGTGTIALAVDHLGQVRRLDGWGPQLGDVGSGYRVGLDGLISACRWVDHRRGGSRILRDAASEIFGKVEDLPRTLRSPEQLRNIARFAELVVEAARRGDIVAGQILDKAAGELAELATDAAALVSSGAGVPIVIGGGFVAAVPELAGRVTKWFAKNPVATPLISPGNSTLDGCQAIGSHGLPEVFAPWTEELA
jgi:N-acetylglucosamine kinase-like BadF-type ATPase